MHDGDAIRACSPGGGGLGSPLERDLQDLEQDMNRGYVSARMACDVYGAVIKTQQDHGCGCILYTLDRKASELRRRQMRSADIST